MLRLNSWKCWRQVAGGVQRRLGHAVLSKGLLNISKSLFCPSCKVNMVCAMHVKNLLRYCDHDWLDQSQRHTCVLTWWNPVPPVGVPLDAASSSLLGVRSLQSKLSSWVALHQDCFHHRLDWNAWWVDICVIFWSNLGMSLSYHFKESNFPSSKWNKRNWKKGTPN